MNNSTSFDSAPNHSPDSEIVTNIGIQTSSDAPPDPNPDSEIVNNMGIQTSSDPASNPGPLSNCSHDSQTRKASLFLWLFSSFQPTKTSSTASLSGPEKFSLPRNMQETWRRIHGEEHWRGLLEPLDIDLRHAILHYGNMAQAAYDGFNREKASKYAGSCLYKSSEFFEMVGLVKGYPYQYKLTKNLYATSGVPLSEAFLMKSSADNPWNGEWNWIGYVAVATDEGKAALGRRDIVVAWRGTVVAVEWWTNFWGSSLVSASEIFDDLATGALGAPKVHEGWLSMYTTDTSGCRSARTQVCEEVMRLVELYKNEEVSITITGHSLGAALATINAVDIAQKLDKLVPENKFPVTAFVFASPHIGDCNFKKQFYKIGKKGHLRLLRIRNAGDLVPLLPPWPCTRNIGMELTINTKESEYLKHPSSLITKHNLEVHLHGVAGVQGRERRFNLVFDRSVALMNKYRDALKDKYCVPVSWRVDWNTGMVQHEGEGTWKFKDVEPESLRDNDHLPPCHICWD